MLRHLLELPQTRGMDVDDPRTSVLRKAIIQEKGFLRHIYMEWYAHLARAIEEREKWQCGGIVLELGAGGGFFSEYCRQRRLPWRVLTSDVLPLPNLDLALDACSLPFASGSLAAIVMTNVFHHIPDVRQFLASCGRVLRAGGVVAMIEPWNTPWARFVYSRLHPEPFMPDVPGWTLEGSGPLSRANDALPWIVFSRDRAALTSAFPEFSPPEIISFMPFAYLASGGVSLRSLLPGCAYRLCRRLEELLPQQLCAMFARIVLQKRIMP